MMRLRLSLLSLLLLATLSAQAETARVQVSATQSDFSIVNADGMLPVWWHSDRMMYADLAGGYGSDDTYILSPGGRVSWY